MNETIMVPLDGSAPAETALPAAVALAHATGRGLLLLGVAVPPTRLSGLGWPQAALVEPVSWWPLELADYEGYLAGVAARLQPSGLPVEILLRQGDPATEILAEVADNPALHTIAMATHGRSGVARTVLGSVAERIIQAAPVPVLLVRSGSPLVAGAPPAYQRILVPLDGSPFAAQALDSATDLAERTGATLLLLTVLPPLQTLSFAEAGLRPYWSEAARIAAADSATLALTTTAVRLESQGLAVRTLLRHGSPAAEIVHCATDEAADLIVLATHGRSGLPRLWLGSVALGVVRSATQPVLTMRPATAGRSVVTTASAPAYAH